MPSVQYTNRRHAGVALAMVLRDMPLENPLVLALPRGGVPVGKEIARALGAPLDVLLVRKIGAPGNEEFALGAIVDGPEPNWVVDEQMLERYDPPPEWFEQQVLEQIRELERRRLLYRGAKAPARLADRDLIVVDDGLATGSSMRAALQCCAVIIRTRWCWLCRSARQKPYRSCVMKWTRWCAWIPRRRSVRWVITTGTSTRSVTRK